MATTDNRTRSLVELTNQIEKILSPEATWKDAFFFYGGAMFPGDEPSPGDLDNETRKLFDQAVEKARGLMKSVSAEERHKEGYYLAHELGEYDVIPANDFKRQGNLGPLFTNIFVTIDVKNWMDFPNVKYIRGNVMFKHNSGPGLEFENLESVIGSIAVEESAGVTTLKNLRSVAGDVIITQRGELSANALEFVNGGIYLNDLCKFEADSLTFVGKKVSLLEYAKLTANALETVKDKIHVGRFSHFVASKLGLEIHNHLDEHNISPKARSAYLNFVKASQNKGPKKKL